MLDVAHGSGFDTFHFWIPLSCKSSSFQSFMGWNEELCFSVFGFQFFLYAPSGALPCIIAVQTKENLRQLRRIPQTLE